MLPDAQAELRMKLQLQLGDAYSIKGLYDEAIAALQPALETARRLGARSVEAGALAQLGRVAGVFRGDYPAGQAYFDEALPIARELQDREALVFITRQLGNIGNALGELEAAGGHLEESLQLAREIGDRASEVNALNSLGINARARDDFEAALRHYQRGLDLAVEIGDRNLRAMLTGNVAEIHYLQGDFASAKRLSERALALAQEAANDSLVASARFWLGASLLRLGEVQQARLHMEEALRMALAMRADSALVFILPEYARLWAGQGEATKAVEWIGLARHHPASDSIGRRYAEQVLSEIRGDLSEDEVQAALQRGAKLDLDDVINSLLEET
jgi:tetratricopeptide (TPR) repeat protein